MLGQGRLSEENQAIKDVWVKVLTLRKVDQKVKNGRESEPRNRVKEERKVRRVRRTKEGTNARGGDDLLEEK